MNKLVRSRMEMAARVRDFLRAHPTEAGGASVALTRFEELLGRAEQLVARQRNGVVATRSATLQRRGIRDALESNLVRYLVAVGLMAAKDRVELAAEFRLPVRLPHLGFLAAVKGMLVKAEAQKDLLVSKGMSDTLLEDLSKGVAEFEATLEASRAGRRDHVGASADLEAVSSEIVEQVRVLDGLVRYRFGNDRELMGGWRSARNVVGPSRPRKDVVPGEAPTSPGDIAPAA